MIEQLIEIAIQYRAPEVCGALALTYVVKRLGRGITFTSILTGLCLAVLGSFLIIWSSGHTPKFILIGQLYLFIFGTIVSAIAQGIVVLVNDYKASQSANPETSDGVNE